jgi:hypothetical protein
MEIAPHAAQSSLLLSAVSLTLVRKVSIVSPVAVRQSGERTFARPGPI